MRRKAAKPAIGNGKGFTRRCPLQPMNEDERYKTLVIRYLQLLCQKSACRIGELPREEMERLGASIRTNGFGVVSIDVSPPADHERQRSLMRAMKEALPAWEEESARGRKEIHPGQGGRDTTRRTRLRRIKESREGQGQPV